VFLKDRLFPRMASNLRSSCLSLLSAGITGMPHPVWFV
jgi:hypothetical protein